MPDQTFTTSTEAETEAVGAKLAATLRGAAVIALHGDLGAGKTVLTRGIARGLGITEPVTSPTFAIIQEYPGRDLRLYHMDMYRIQGEHDALAFGIDEYLFDSDAVSVIEWAERITELLPPHHLVITITRHHDHRRIHISTSDSAPKPLPPPGFAE